MKKYSLVILIMGIAMTGLFAQKKVISLPQDSAFSFGKNYVVYALPKTAFQVDVTVKRSHEFAGIYSQYAEQLLGLTHVISRDNVSYSLKDIEIKAVALPDTMCVYAVELSSSQIKQGMPLQRKLSSAVSAREQDVVQYDEQQVIIPDFFRYYSDLAYKEQVDSYTETQLVDGVLRQVPAQMVQKVARTNAQQAQDAADKIGKIREDRYELLIGGTEVPYPAATFETMLENLNEMEKNYLSLFTGFVVDDEQHFTVVVIPDSTTRQLPLFSVSSSVGFNTRLSAKPAENYYLQLQPEEEVASVDDFTVQWSCAKGHKPNTGYRIRVPRSTHITLMQGGASLRVFGSCDVYQFGTIEVLPLNRKDIDIEKIGFVF